MVDRIISAYYFNPVPTTNLPWTDTAKPYTLRWCIHGNAYMEINDKSLHLQSNQILISSPNSKITMNLENEQNLTYAVSAFEGDLSFLDSLPMDVPMTVFAPEQDMLFQYFYASSQYYSDTPGQENNRLIKEYTVSLLETFLLRINILYSESKNMIFPETAKLTTHINDQKITMDIKEYLGEHLYDNISLKALSESVGVSVNTAMHVFKKDVGMGIMTYFKKLKIEKAMQLISDGELSFRTISERLGFESPEYFSRVFKKKTGMTPTEYSKQQAKWSGCLASLFM